MTLKYVNKFIFMLYVYIDRFCEIYPEQLQILSFGFIYEISFIHLQGLQNEVLYHEWLLIGQAQFVLTPEGDSEGLAADWLIFSGPVHTLSVSALWWSGSDRPQLLHKDVCSSIKVFVCMWLTALCVSGRETMICALWSQIILQKSCMVFGRGFWVTMNSRLWW